MKMTYEEFKNKLKPEIKEDLKTHKEKTFLEMILKEFYDKKLEIYQNHGDFDCELGSNKFIIWDFFDFISCFKNKKYKKAWQTFHLTIVDCTGCFGYAIIKECEVLFYEKR